MDQQSGRDWNFHCGSCLIGLGFIVWLSFGTTVTAAEFRIPADPKFVLNSFGVICFGLVGLELASVMGDEIQRAAKNSAWRCRVGRVASRERCTSARR